jgi:hypothetical protein
MRKCLGNISGIEPIFIVNNVRRGAICCVLGTIGRLNMVSSLRLETPSLDFLLLALVGFLSPSACAGEGVACTP